MPWKYCQILNPPIRRNVKLAEAPSFGQTIFDYEPECAGAKDYAALALSVLEIDPFTRLKTTVEVKPAEESSEQMIHVAE